MIEQTLAGDADGDQRSRASGLNVQRRSAQTEFVSGAVGEEILLVGDDGANDADCFHQVAALPDKIRVVSAVARAGEESDEAGVSGWVAAGIFERGPGDFEKDPVLRIHDFRFFQRDAEERPVEPLRFLHQPACADVTGQRSQNFGIISGGRELLIGETCDAVLALDEVSPEFRGIARLGKTALEADDGDTVE